MPKDLSNYYFSGSGTCGMGPANVAKGATHVQKAPGSLAGQQFIIEDVNDCTIEVLDHCSQVTVVRHIRIPAVDSFGNP